MYALLIFALQAFTAVVELSESNFINFKYLMLVEFYSDSCSVCEQFKPEYAQISNQLSKEGYTVGSVNFERHLELFQKYNITETPTLLLFINGTPFKYIHGYPYSEKVLKWARKLPSKSYHVYSTLKDYLAIRNTHVEKSIRLMCSGTDSNLTQIYDLLSKMNDDFDFYMIDIDPIQGTYNFNESRYLTLYAYGVMQTYHGIYTLQDMNEFIATYRLATYSPYSEEHQVELFYNHKTILLFMIREETSYFINTYFSVFEKYKGKLIPCYFNGHSSPDPQEFLGVHLSDSPSVVIIDNEGKYLYQGDFQLKKITQFIELYLDHNLPKYYKTETIKERMYNGVIYNIGRCNLQEFIDKPGMKALLVYNSKVYSDDYIRSIEIISKKYKEMVYGKLDLRKNSIDDMLEVEHTPEVILYEDSTVLRIHTGRMDASAIVEFLFS